MTAVRSRTKTVAAVAGVLAVAAGSVAGTAGSASAASVQLKYTCSTAYGPIQVLASGDTSLPSSIVLGKTLTGVKSTAKVVLPADLHALAYKSLGARSALGSASVNLNVGGAAKTVKGPIAKTPVTGVGTLVLPASGTFSVTASSLGPKRAVAGAFTANVRFLRADGSEALALPVSCKPTAGVTQDLTVDKYTVVRALTARAVGAVTAAD